MRLVALCAVVLAATVARAVHVPKPAEEVDVERIIRSMSVEEKVGQLIMIGFGGTELNSHSRHWIEDRRVGGVALFSRNIKDFEQTDRFTRELHALTDGYIPIFLALDQEGGNVVRVK